MVRKLVVAAALAVLLDAPAAAQDAATDLANTPGHHGGAVPGWRSGRPCRRGSSRSVSSESLGPAGHHREYRRGRRHDRRGSGREVAAGRLDVRCSARKATHTFSQMIYKKPLYDAVKDFAPVAVVVENSKLLLTRKDFPVNNRCRSSSPTPRPTRPSCNTARPAPARRRMSPACCSTTRSASTSRTCPIAAPRRRCRTSSAAASTISASRVDRAPFVQAGMVKTHRAALAGAQPRLCPTCRPRTNRA